MPSFDGAKTIRVPRDLRIALEAIAQDEGKSFGGLCKGAALIVYRDKLSAQLGAARYNELVAEYVKEDASND